MKVNARARASYWKEEGYGMKATGEFGKDSSREGGEGGATTTATAPSALTSTLSTRRSFRVIDACELKDETASIAIETFASKAERIRASSPYGHLPNWKLDGLIAKSNDDVRQEVNIIIF